MIAAAVTRGREEQYVERRVEHRPREEELRRVLGDEALSQLPAGAEDQAERSVCRERAEHPYDAEARIERVAPEARPPGIEEIERAVAHIDATELEAGRFVDTLPEGTIASFDIGGTGYVSRRPVVDLGGLSDPKTAALLESGRISTWLVENQVRWLVLPQSYESTLPTFDDYRTRLHLAGNASLRLEPVRVFETPLDRWEPAIRATWNAAPKQVVYEVTYTKEPGPREVPMVAPKAFRAIPDPARLVRVRDRIVAEHMLATLAAWDLPVDVKLVPSRPETESSAASAAPGIASAT